MDMLSSLFREVKEGYINIWSGKDKSSSWFGIHDLDIAMERARILTDQGHDVYFSCCPQEVIPAKGRGRSESVLCVPFVWVEIDVEDSEAHANGGYPPDAAAVKLLLEEFGIEPSWGVNSGHGYHFYWILDSPLERDEGAALERNVQQRIRELAKKHGWTVDNTSDLARVLRVPGTVNFKSTPKEVKVVLNTDLQYTVSDFMDVIRAGTPKKPEPPAFLSPDAYSAQRVVSHCPFFAGMYEGQRYVPEQEWFTLITNLAQCADGLQVIRKMHDFCRPPSRGYQWRETQEKFVRAQAEKKPHTCLYIMEQFTPEVCKSCPHTSIGAPVALGAPNKEWLDAVERVTSGTSDDPIEDLATLKLQNPEVYKEIRKKVVEEEGESQSVLEKKVSARVKERVALQTGGGDLRLLDDVYPDFPVKQLMLPPGWDFSDAGVRKLIYGTDMMTKKTVVACSVPIGIKARYRNVESGEETVELTWYADDRWNTVTDKRSVVFDRRKIIQLADYGVPVTSERAKDLVTFLTDFEDYNRHTIPPFRSIQRFGWCSGTEFHPYGAPNVLLDVDPSVNGCVVKGALDTWKELVLPVYRTHQSRFMMSAAFTTPLLKILDVRSMIVHLWGGSGKGKTATLKAALSVWGDTDRLMVNFNATVTGIERQSALFCDLPVGVDEKQAGTNQNNFMSVIVYVISGGMSKLRGNKAGGIDRMRHWRTIALTNGEHPLTEDNTSEGVKTRSIELKAGDIDAELAHALHTGVCYQYGVAGDAFIQKLLSTDKAKIKLMFEEALDELLAHAEGKSRSHVDLIAAIAVGDMLSRQWIFGVEPRTARMEAMILAQWVLGMMETEAQRNDTSRAYDMFASWVWGNQDRFRGAEAAQDREQFGEMMYEHVRIVPHKFNELMTGWGFSPKRVLSDLAERGVLITEDGHCTVRSRTFTTGRRVRMYEIDLKEEAPYETTIVIDAEKDDLFEFRE